MARKLRIAVLLFILATVAQMTWLERKRVVDWAHPLRVVIYPILADDTPAANAYLEALDGQHFAQIDAWFARESARHGLALSRPIEIALGPRVGTLPPDMPRQPGMLSAVAWSLRMRFWAWRNDDYPGPRPNVRLFLVYHDPARSPRVGHSTGLAKGMIGVVRIFAARSQSRMNDVVIAHELLHTFGATDKYDFATNMPRFPEGYAQPEANPRLPQRLAEIMGGRIPRTPFEALMPDSLDDTIVGEVTAREIRWR